MSTCTLGQRFAFYMAALCLVPSGRAETIPVRYKQGSMHGFVVLKTLEGSALATGEITQIVQGSRVTSRMVLHFRDGSLDDDSTVFTQSRVFHLVSSHHIQRGPFFPQPMDMLIETATGQITSRAEDGTKTVEHMDLPPDVSNGLPPNLLLNVLPSTPETKITYVVVGKKPRLITLSIKPVGKLPFNVGGLKRSATDFSLHIELGGLSGVVAPLVGKQPPDVHIWIGDGTPPAFVKEEGQIYENSPILRIEQAAPAFH